MPRGSRTAVVRDSDGLYRHAVPTILVADDEQLIRWSLSERLKADGLRVVEAATGQEAIDRVHAGVDLVLLDYELPDIDGVTVLRNIKQYDSDMVETYCVPLSL